MNESDTLQKAISQFRRAAISKGAEGGETDHQLYDQIADAYHQMLAAGKNGIDALQALANDSDPNVQSWAASQSLYDGDRTMLVVLERLAQRDDMIGFNASMVLREHKNGTLGSPLPKLPGRTNRG